MTPARLLLIRHARSAHIQTGWLNTDDLRSWRVAYEAAGILDGQRPPPALRAIARRADLIVCSNAARAIATARLLVPGREPIVSPLLREMDLPGPNLRRVRLPLTGWAFAVAGHALLLSARKLFPSRAELDRIHAAADWLNELAEHHRLIAVVTHASFRGELAKRLTQIGWRAEPGRRTMRHWSVWGFTSMKKSR